jgi:hypothetical protein
MKIKLKILSMAALAVVAAATTMHASTTNIVQNVSVQLTVYSQGASSKSKSGTTTTPIISQALTTKVLIAALSTDTNVTPKPFSSAAFLALVRVLGSGDSALAVVDGDNIVPITNSVISGTDSSTFTHSVVNSGGFTTSESEVSVFTLNVNIPNVWSFTATGTDASTREYITVGKATAHIDNSTINVSGPGTQGAITPVIVAGKITTSYLKTLIVK